MSSGEAVSIHCMALAMALTAFCTSSGSDWISASEVMTVNSS